MWLALTALSCHFPQHSIGSLQTAVHVRGKTTFHARSAIQIDCYAIPLRLVNANVHDTKHYTSHVASIWFWAALAQVIS